MSDLTLAPEPSPEPRLGVCAGTMSEFFAAAALEAPSYSLIDGSSWVPNEARENLDDGTKKGQVCTTRRLEGPNLTLTPDASLNPDP